MQATKELLANLKRFDQTWWGSRPLPDVNFEQRTRITPVSLEACGSPVAELYPAEGSNICWKRRTATLGASACVQSLLILFGYNLNILFFHSILHSYLCAGTAAMDTDEALTPTAEDAASKEAGAAEAAESAAEGASEEGVKTAPAVESEPTSYEVANPARVVPAQQKYVSFPAGSRWEPLRRGAKSGIVLLRDLRPGAPPAVCALNPVLICRAHCWRCAPRCMKKKGLTVCLHACRRAC